MTDNLLRDALKEAIYEITHLSPRTCGPNEDSYQSRIKASKVDGWRAALAEAQQGEATITVKVERAKLMWRALIEKDLNEAYHQLYEACNSDQPESDPYRPWEHLWEEDQDSGPVGGMARPKESDQPEGNSHGITGNYRIAASDGPALKCPNHSCIGGYIRKWPTGPNQWVDCPTCHGTGEKP